MKNEYIVTWKLYRSWAIENMLNGTPFIFMIVWCLLGFVLIGVALSDSLGLFYLILALFCFYRAFVKTFLVAKKQYRTLSKVYEQENWTRTITFGDDQITITEKNLSLQFSYADILNIREKDEKIWLDMKDKTVIRLYQHAFINTDWAECKAEILSKKEHLENQ